MGPLELVRRAKELQEEINAAGLGPPPAPRLFVWRQVLEHHGYGLCFAIAATEDEARAAVARQVAALGIGPDPERYLGWGFLEPPDVYAAPYADFIEGSH